MSHELLGFIANRAKAALLVQLADLMEASPPISDLEIDDAFYALIVAGIEREELARCFRVDVVTIRHWEMSRKVPPHTSRESYVAHLVRIARRHAAMFAVVGGTEPVAKAA